MKNAYNNGQRKKKALEGLVGGEGEGETTLEKEEFYFVPTV